MKAPTKYSELSPLEAIRRDLDRIFDEISPLSKMQGSNGGNGMQLWAPDTDVSETDNAYMVSVDLPGFSKEDVEVSYSDNRLTISGKRKYEEKEEEEDFLRKERYHGTFTRSFTLSSEVKADDIKANFKDGVLSVRIPKSEVKKSKEISIE